MPQGLLDVIAVGNLIELTNALDLSSYTGNTQTGSKDEKEAAQTRYRIFMRWFSHEHIVFVNKTWVTASYIFKRRLIDFAATVLHYKRVHHDEGSGVAGFTAKALQRRLHQHFVKYWPELLPAFLAAIEKPSPFMYWTGPKISILPRTQVVVQQLGTVGMKEHSDLSDVPIYLESHALLTASTPPPAPQLVESWDVRGEEPSAGTTGPSNGPGPSRKRPHSPPMPNDPESPASRELKRIKDAGGLRKVSHRG